MMSLSVLLTKALRKAKSLLFYVPVQISLPDWESAYGRGCWERIAQLDERGHYSVIVGYVHHLKENAKILDVGCGEGLLKRRLCSAQYAYYLGFDISTNAIAKACTFCDDKSIFKINSIEEFDSSERFDIIIFNESLYYVCYPLQVLKKYEAYLSSQGVFIVSMNRCRNTRILFSDLDRRYTVLDEVTITNSKGAEWVVKVFSVS
ncbi:MAG: class I SAM-dependent methyltransferase [Syntrophobacteraceae bacterium]